MNKEILEKAIQKAIDSGFAQNDMGQEIKTVRDVYYYFDNDHGDLSVNDLIWRHDFAKALWGEKIILMSAPTEVKDGVVTKRGSVWVPAWQGHLQTMVIADDPIKYLGENT